MGSVNPTLQLAAALDRRGITTLLNQGQLAVRIGRDSSPMPIKPAILGEPRWTWTYCAKDGSHPCDDYEGTAETIEKFLRDIPALADTELLYRMDHMGWTMQQEGDELLQRARCQAAAPLRGKEAQEWPMTSPAGRSPSPPAQEHDSPGS